MNKQKLITLLLLVAVFFFVVWTVYNNKPLEKTRIDLGNAAPDFQAVNTLGQQAALSDYKGKVVVLNFWASWCEPCVKEMPLIRDVFESNKNDMVTLFVNVGETKGTVQEYLTAHQFDFPVIIDVTGKLSALYGVVGLPATFIIDPEGNLEHILLGEINSSAQLQNHITAAKED